MEMVPIINSMNEKQRKAVTAPRRNMLVLAGAGSGKTLVLVHRIAWLMEKENCSVSSIIAVTFTNKAAEEMRKRIKKMIRTSTDGMWIGTFHSLSHRLLRAHHVDVCLPHNFQIIDSEDQLRLLNSIMNNLNIDEKKFTTMQALYYINKKKENGIRIKNIKTYKNKKEETFLRIYYAYQKACDNAGLIDFSEMILRVYELWLNKPNIIKIYRNRFQNILVDEFQDINRIQYDWIRILAGKNSKVMIVGDDDQSIYGWRGAQAENIQCFLKDFSGAETIFLEQNYRSTKNILKAANVLISYNHARMGKKLWTKREKGEPISLYCALNELEEARFVVHSIQNWKENGGLLKECAILYRNNTQSRVIENALLQMAIPYRIYGGLRFFERKEIKDSLAYLRFIENRNDDTAFERIVNKPNRGIGEITIKFLRNTAKKIKLPLWQTTGFLLQEKEVLLGQASSSALQMFITLFDEMSHEIEEMPIHLKTDYVIKKSGLLFLYENGPMEKEENIMVENIKELVNYTRQFSYKEKYFSLQEFLSHAILESGEERDNVYKNDVVHLMTLHSSKGLEFRNVFIVGMEEGIFPKKMYLLDEEKSLEEERRLAYVGITRAMKKLTLTYTKKRRIYGKEISPLPSCFLSEIPEECVEKVEIIK